MNQSNQSANSPERTIVTWKPDYAHKCRNCGQKPVVTGVDENDKRVYPTDTYFMCGVCTWGEAACLDPENW